MRQPVFDFHLHVALYDDAPPGFDDFLARYQGDDLDAFYDRYRTPEQLLGLLDENGVDAGVFLAELDPLTTGIVSNEHIQEICAHSPRFLPFASVNPYLQNAPNRELERLVKEHGFRGLKMYPTYQYFYSNDALVYPIYEVCQQLEIPMMVHTGSSVFKGSRLKYGDPMALDDVAVDFPDLKILMSHGGRPFWYDRAYALARLHENVYIDLAGLPPSRLLDYFPELERIADKLVFGSDWPGIPGRIRDNIEAVKALPIADSTVRKILWENAARILPDLSPADDLPEEPHVSGR